MQRTFWLLDLNHESYEGKSSIWLWGITHEGKRVLVIDNNYRPYFYLLPRQEQDPEELRKKLEAEKPHPTIENVTIEKKKLLADERVVLKVFCKDPDFLEKAARETLKKTAAEATYEEKLRLAIKYQYDHGIKPCQWYEADTTASKIDPKKFNVQETLTATDHPRSIPKEEPPSLDLLSFSLLSVSKIGAPSPIRDPIKIISWRTEKANDVLLTQADSDQTTIQTFGEDVVKNGEEAIDYVIQISALSGLPPDQVIAAAVGFRVDNYLMMETHNLGQLIPPRTEQPIIPYKGAIVLEPKVGLHDNVASLDFSSMYPSLMIKYNISPDTLVTGKEREDVFEVPEVKHRFRKSPSGFYRIVLTKLIEARKTTKAELKRTAPSDSRYPLLKAREKAVKVMTNAVYGY